KRTVGCQRTASETSLLVGVYSFPQNIFGTQKPRWSKSFCLQGNRVFGPYGIPFADTISSKLPHLFTALDRNLHRVNASASDCIAMTCSAGIGRDHHARLIVPIHLKQEGEVAYFSPA